MRLDLESGKRMDNYDKRSMVLPLGKHRAGFIPIDMVKGGRCAAIIVATHIRATNRLSLSVQEHAQLYSVSLLSHF